MFFFNFYRESWAFVFLNTNTPFASFVSLNTSIWIHLLSFWIFCAIFNNATEKRLTKLNVNILAKLVFACRSRRCTRVALALLSLALSLSLLLAFLLSDMLSLLLWCEFAAMAKLGWRGLLSGLSLCACLCMCMNLSASLRGVAAAAALISLLLLLLLCCFVGLRCPCLDIQPCIYGGEVISPFSCCLR